MPLLWNQFKLFWNQFTETLHLSKIRLFRFYIFKSFTLPKSVKLEILKKFFSWKSEQIVATLQPNILQMHIWNNCIFVFSWSVPRVIIKLKLSAKGFFILQVNPFYFCQFQALNVSAASRIFLGEPVDCLV